MNADARRHPRRRRRRARQRRSSTSARRPTCARATTRRARSAVDRFVVTPGLVNTHIHVTGEPLTRGYVPDDTPFEENVFEWLCPLYAVHDAADERTSAQLAAVEMLRSGTTTFLEAGTIRFLDDVIDGLDEIGHPRPGRQLGVGPPARAGRLPPGHRRRHRPSRTASSTTTARLAERRVSAWSTLVGHTTCSDPLWRAAKRAGRRARRRDELPHVAGAASTPTASSPSSASARWSTSTRSACSTPTSP